MMFSRERQAIQQASRDDGGFDAPGGKNELYLDCD
jgi:hypothetical protein